MASEMRPLSSEVESATAKALDELVSPELAGADPLVRRSEHADFQSNAAMTLARKAGMDPRELATKVAAALEDNWSITHAEAAGPGFVNITISDAELLHRVARRLEDDRLGVGWPEQGRRTVIDYSAPNIAKEMHVAHLRTTIIGDALARILDFLGADVVPQNHLGDWGTQFGMLIQYMDEHPEASWRREHLEKGGTDSVSALERLYQAARREFDADAGFVERARRRVVALQSGDEETVGRWREIVAESELSFQAIYDRLGVLLGPEHAAGESSYNHYLFDVVDELSRKGVLAESDGALCVFFDDIRGADGERVPLIVRKQDGGFGYAATDLATIRYRIHELKATRLLYVVDARQALHFRMVFETARRAGWLTDDLEAVHVAFGTVLGTDGRPFKTRSGGTMRLMELLDAAMESARSAVAEKVHGLDAYEMKEVVQQAGVAAVKYADLSTKRTKDYIFDVEDMVKLNGDTGVYLQYAHARIRSILRKIPADTLRVAVTHPDVPLQPAERALGLALDAFGEKLAEVSHTLEPHRLCGYLFSLAKTFTDFYDACPVRRAETNERRDNRIELCRLTGETLAQGLHVLGIAAPERI